MAAVTFDDVQTVIGYPIEDAFQVSQVDQWIDDVDMLLTARLGDLSAVNQNVLRYVEREAVVARMKYQDDKNSEAAADRKSDSSTEFFLSWLGPWWKMLAVERPRGASAFSVIPG